LQSVTQVKFCNSWRDKRRDSEK